MSKMKSSVIRLKGDPKKWPLLATNAACDSLFIDGSYKKVRVAPTREQHIITQAKQNYVARGKHVGSKPMKRLLQGISREAFNINFNKSDEQ